MKNIYLNLVKSQKFYISIIIFVLTLTYINTFSFDLIFLDDDTLIYEKFKDRTFIEKIDHAFTWNYLGGKYYRPVTLTTFIFEEELWGGSYFIYHFTNFIIHLFTCIFLFLLLKNVGYKLFTSFLAVLLFAINPLHINAIGWIAGRGDLLAGFFSVFALYVFQKYLLQEKLKLIPAVSFLLLLAILSKEVAIIMPFLFLAYYFLEKKEILLNKKDLYILALIISALGSYYLLRGVLLTDVHLTKFSFTTFYRNILVLPETVSKFFLPLGIKALQGLNTFASVSGIIIFILLLFIPLKIKGINKFSYYFGLTWFILLMLPGMVFRTMEQDGFFYWDCRSYLPSLGLVIMAAEAFNAFTLNKNRNKYFALVLFYILILGVATFIKINLYKNPVTYWGSVISDYPDLFLPHVALYNYYMHNQEPDNAEKELLKGINKNPQESSIRKMLIDFYIRNDKKHKALDSAKDALVHVNNNIKFFIEKYVALSLESENDENIDYLVSKYSGKKEITDMINHLLVKEIERLINTSDIKKADKVEIMRQKVSASFLEEER